MIAQISIIIERNASNYVAYSPTIEGSTVQGDSLDTVINDIKEIVKPHLSKNDNTKNNSSEPDEPDGIQTLLEFVKELTSDMTPEEIAQLPTDGAEQHDHYIYGTPKR